MQKLPLIGGSYSTRSVIANAQRCLNLFPEVNRKDSPTGFTHYQRPGLVQLATGVKARGYISFASSGNPSNGDTMTLNGVVWTFVSGAPVGNQIQIGGVLVLTMSAAIVALNASVVPAVAVATYVQTTGNTINVIYDTVGTTGNTYTLAASAATPSGPNLTTGLDFTVSPARGRAIYQASNGEGYAVIGEWLYWIDTNFDLVRVGQLTTGLTNPCSMIDNGTTLLVVDGNLAVAGAGGGWTVTLATHASFTVMNDPAWTGADRVDYLDGFVVWNMPGTRNFGSTLFNQITPLDPLYIAGKVGYPDPLQAVIVAKRLLMLPGTLKSEIWYDAGNPSFPFAELQGSYVEHGTAAKYSFAATDDAVFWLARDLAGQGYVLKHSGQETKRISNYALEYQIRLMYQNGGSIADAIGYTYQIDGHLFYVLSFPSANQTWVWDESVGDPELGWSQRGWTDSNGQFNRDRGVLGAHLNGKNVCIDWENGVIYEQSMTSYTDQVLNQEYPILYLRTFPHLMSGINPADGQPILAEGKMVAHERFQIDIEVGTGPVGTTPTFSLRWSDDRGKTWGNPVQLEAGAQGKYGTRPDLRNLGQAMDRVYELSWSFAGQVALNGAWVEGKVLGQ